MSAPAARYTIAPTPAEPYISASFSASPTFLVAARERAAEQGLNFSNYVRMLIQRDLAQAAGTER